MLAKLFLNKTKSSPPSNFYYEFDSSFEVVKVYQLLFRKPFKYNLSENLMGTGREELN